MTAPPRPRVAFLGVYHETNTFSSIPTGREAFARRWHRGEELIEHFGGTRTVGGGFIDGARSAGWELVPVFGAYATPSGPVAPEALASIRSEIAAGLAQAGPIDGVLFELHGDLVVEGETDAEESLVSLVRGLLPGKPVAVVLDLHANMAAPRFREVEVLVGYRTNPHVDTFERGREAAELLAPLLRGAPRPYRAHSGLPVLAAPFAQRTDDEPLRSLLARADALQAEPGLQNVTVHAGYAFADTEYAGIGFHATADAGAEALADRAVAELRALAESLAPAFRRPLVEAEDAIAQAVTARSPVAVADTGDNINGGAPGDTTWLVHEALRHPGHRFLGTLADRDAVRRAHEAGEGARIRLSMGGRASPLSGAPVDAEVEVVRVGDGRFVNIGPMATGAQADLDGAAWVRLEGVDLLLQGSACQPNDPGMFTAMGIDPADYDVILLKGAAALRAAWTPLVTGFIDAATIGETDSRIDRLEYRRARPRF